MSSPQGSQDSPKGSLDAPSNAGKAALEVAIVETSDNKPETTADGKLTKASKDKDMVPYFTLFRYADRLDWLLMFMGSVAGIVNGATIPLFAVVFGDLLNVFGGTTTCADYVNETNGKPPPDQAPTAGVTYDDLTSTVNKYCLYFVYLGLITLVASYGEVAFWMYTGARQANRVRAKYLKAVLHQDVAFFDRDTTTGQLLLGLNEDTLAYQNAISEKVGTFLHNFFTFVIGIAIALWRGWELALIIVAMTPLLAIIGAAISVLGSKLTKQANVAYAEANTIAQQALGNIRTVAAFNGEPKAVQRYSSSLVVPEKVGIKQGFMQGIILGATNGIWFLSYAAAMYYGATQVVAGEYSGGDVMNIIFAAIIGGFALGQAVPSLQYFRQGRVAGASLFKAINMKPTIDLDAPGEELAEVKGHVELKDVTFAYPSRPERAVFSSFSLSIPAGSSIALVGESGSGKSTAVQLIQRFYDPEAGSIMLDGHDLRTLQLRWLRGQMGMVGQEPMLFATTIRENILYSKPDATEEEVMAAAKAANAYDFVTRLPNGFDTHVGEKGTAMSGGQKQRIAIARAILRNPKILLLDEATSALDAESESIVQAALDKLMVGRTTVIVAHRLSTIIDADMIAVVKEGTIVEKGHHDELMALDGYYNALVSAQAAAGEDEAQNEGSGGKHGDGAFDSLAEFEPGKLEDIEEMEGGKKDEKKQKKKKDDKVKVGFFRLAAMNKPEWLYFVVGAFSSACLGFTMPGFSLALASIIGVYYTPAGPGCTDTILDGAQKWALIFTAIGVGCIILGTLQGYTFGLMGQKLARRLRVLLFRTILRQEIGWFDRKENSSGAIIGRLAQDTVVVRGAVGDQIALVLQNLVTIIASCLIAFTASWSMTLVVMACLPVLGVASIIQNKFFFGFSNEADKLFSSANQTAAEALGSIRTIAAFSLQDQICELYQRGMVGPEKKIRQRANSAGAGFGFSQFVFFNVYALAFWFGGQEVSDGNLTFDDMLKAFFAILLAAFGMAQAQMAFPDMGKASTAVQRVFEIIDRKPLIDSADPAGDKLDLVEGHVELKNVSFSYPTRSEVTVFKNFSLEVKPGTSLALVGESGSGKSTVVGLLERFYDPIEGAVLLDGVDIRKLNIKWLRTQIGLVNQEPVLFTASVIDNIRYGKENATLEEVMAAAKVANALDFIEKLPEKYDTKVGEGGISLSGGQKQRIAIARAVLKDPKILLLDEATSALDAENERLVQLALDKITVNRTTLIVAHRLSTIRTADFIAVVSRGKIIESGAHESLMQRSGSYAKLVRHQSSSRSTRALMSSSSRQLSTK